MEEEIENYDRSDICRIKGRDRKLIDLGYKYGSEDARTQQNIEDIRIIEKLINKYLKEEKKICLEVRKEWKMEEAEKKITHLGINYPRIYSNQYYAFMELKKFWEELKSQLSLSNGDGK